MGYVLRWGPSIGTYPNTLDAGSTTSTMVGGLVPGNTYFAVVEAYNADREYSLPSNVLSFVAPLNCTYSLNPMSIALGPTGGDGTMFLTALAPACPWSVTAGSPFLTFTNGTGRSGTGPLPFSVDRNYSTRARSGGATIAGLNFTMTQGAAEPNPAVVARERTRSDFNGDGFSDLLWFDTTNGYVAAWLLQGGHTARTPVLASQKITDMNWRIAGTADFNADGKPDIVWHNQVTGALRLWYMDGLNVTSQASFSHLISDVRWKVVGVADFNSDGKPDLVWQHETAGWLAVWMLDGTTLVRGVDMNPIRVLDVRWRIQGVADLNNDGHPDLLFRHRTTGELALWSMVGTNRLEYKQLRPGFLTDADWRIASLMDVDGDQTTDIVWQHDTVGWIAVWYMNGTTRIDAQSLPVWVETNWKIVGSR